MYTCGHNETTEPSRELTLADILDRISADATLDKRRRQEIACAIRVLSKKVFRRQPAEIAASAPSLRARLAEITAASVGLTADRLNNLISLLRFTLNHTGVADWPARHQRSLAPQWRELLALAGDNQKRFWLSKFAGYCSAKDIPPALVSDKVVDRFYRDLDTTTLKRKPETVHRKVCTFWNEAASTVIGWPQARLTVPDRRKSYVLPWSSFPHTFLEDVEAYLAYLGGDDVLAIRHFTPLRSTSIRTTRELIRQYASALVHCGYDRNAIKLLSDLLPMETVKRGLRYYTSRPNGSGNRQAHRYLVLLNTLAKRWVDIEPAHAQQLKLLLTSVGKQIGNAKQRGLTEKNKVRLHQFDDDEGLSALLSAPQRIMACLPLDGPPTHDEAIAAQTALAIELFLMIPIRIKNAAGLDIDRQIIRGRDGSARITISSQEVKNSFPIEAPLPKPTAELLDLYLTHFRPKLQNAHTSWLFPGRDPSSPKSIQQLRKQIQDKLAREIGLTVNPHLFRHIAAMIFLRANPGQYAVVKLLLGHKSIETTIAFYCGFEASAAVRQYDRHVLLCRSSFANTTPAAA